MLASLGDPYTRFLSPEQVISSLYTYIYVCIVDSDMYVSISIQFLEEGRISTTWAFKSFFGSGRYTELEILFPSLILQSVKHFGCFFFHL